jgi:hypothetical protein
MRSLSTRILPLIVAPLAFGLASPVSATADPVTPEELSAAAERSSATPSRFELFIDVSGVPSDEGAVPLDSIVASDAGAVPPDTRTPVATGEIDGTSTRVQMNLGPLLAELAQGAALPVGDLAFEAIVMPDAYYLRAPMLAELANEVSEAAASLGAFVDLGEGWGRVDLAALGASPGDVGGTLGTTGAYPPEMFDAVAAAAKLTDIGTETIRGVPSTGVQADVELSRLLEGQGADPAEVPELDTSLTGVTFPMQVWIGEDGFIHRVSFTIDDATLAAAAQATGQQMGPADMFAGLSLTLTLESFDYGAADIAITAPVEFVDITGALTQLLGDGDWAAAPSGG